MRHATPECNSILWCDESLTFPILPVRVRTESAYSQRTVLTRETGSKTALPFESKIKLLDFVFLPDAQTHRAGDFDVFGLAMQEGAESVGLRP